MKIRHIIFDIDGVLVDSLHANHVTLIETMLRFGFVEDNSDIMFAPIPTTEKLEYLEKTQGHTLDDVMRQEFLKCKYELLLEKHDLIKINPHAINCVKELFNRNISMSYISNARTAYINLILEKMGITDTATCIIGNDCGFARKPNAKIFLHVAEKINVPAENILVVDDHYENLNPLREVGFQILKIDKFEDVLKIGKLI